MIKNILQSTFWKMFHAMKLTYLLCTRSKLLLMLESSQDSMATYGNILRLRFYHQHLMHHGGKWLKVTLFCKFKIITQPIIYKILYILRWRRKILKCTILCTKNVQIRWFSVIFGDSWRASSYSLFQETKEPQKSWFYWRFQYFQDLRGPWKLHI